MNDALIEALDPPKDIPRDKVEETIKQGVFGAMKALAAKGVAASDVGDFAAAMIRRAPKPRAGDFVGEDAIAALVWEAYTDAPRGSMGRVQIMKSIIQLLSKMLDHAGGSVEDSDDADLEEQAAVLMAPMFGDELDIEGLELELEEEMPDVEEDGDE